MYYDAVPDILCWIICATSRITKMQAAFILHIGFPRFLFFLPEVSLQSKKSRSHDIPTQRIKQSVRRAHFHTDKSARHKKRHSGDNTDLGFHLHTFFSHIGFQILFVKIGTGKPVMKAR